MIARRRVRFGSGRGRCPAAVIRLIGMALPAIAVGCGPNGPVRYDIEGVITFDGKPVPSGMIRFEPDATKGNSGPVGYAMIIDGRYTTAEQGSKGSLKGPLVAFLNGGPAPDPKVEFPKMWFSDYKTTLTLDPKVGVMMFNVDVPKEYWQ